MSESSMAMENEGEAPGSPPVEDRSLPRRHSPTSSLWLHAALSDFDAKTQRMLHLIQGDGESFAERAEMYYKRRPELTEMLKDSHKSYSSLAQRHDKLRSHYVQVTTSSRLESSSSTPSDRAEHAKSQLSRHPGSGEDSLCPAVPTIQSKSYPEDHDLITVGTGEVDLPTRVTNGSPSTTCLKVAGETKEKEGIEETSAIREETLEGLTTTYEWMQAELIRRNEEKGRKIKELSSRINLLVSETAELKSRLSAREVKRVSAFEVERIHPQEILGVCSCWFCSNSV